jgi:glutathione S-transferase
LEKKREIGIELNRAVLLPFLKNVEQVLDDNGGHYLVGDSLTYADIAIASMLRNLMDWWFGHTWKTLSPPMADFADRIMAIPKMKRWNECKPERKSTF